MGGWVQIGPNQYGHGGRVRESRKLFDEVMPPDLLEQEEFFRSMGEPHEALGSHDFARIESAEKGLKRLPFHGHRKSPGHAAVASVQMRGGRRLRIMGCAIRHINARLGRRQAEKIADVW